MRLLDDADGVLHLWMPYGTERLVPAGGHDRVVDNLAGETWDYAVHVWDVSTLAVVRPEDGFAIWASWLPTGEHLGYYVNLQRPYQRTELGFEAMDLMLDIVVDPDLTWRWKDEHEVQELLDRGVYDQELVDGVRAQAQRAIALIESGAAPFDGSLLAERPSDTELPRLPASLLELASQS